MRRISLPWLVIGLILLAWAIWSLVMA